MQATVLYGARDVRFEDRPDPAIVEPTDAIIRLPLTCICGSTCGRARGIQAVSSPAAMGHEYCGFVEEVGRGVTSFKPGRFVIGSFFASDNTCRIASTATRRRVSAPNRCWARRRRACAVPLADGTLVATQETPDSEMLPSMLALSDVMGTGWFAAGPRTSCRDPR